MEIRPYRAGEAPVLAALFYDSVHRVAIRDYSREACRAWADGRVDTAAWDRRFRASRTLVAEAAGRPVGFGNITAAGYLDMLYTAADCQGRGVATALCDQLEAGVSVPAITVHASRTARGFFEKRGYVTVRGQAVLRHGVVLENFIMEKYL